MTARQNLNRVQYSGLDFETIEADFIANLQVQYASQMNEFAVSSLGMVLIDILSYGLDTLSFYLDRRATEFFLSTARSRDSVSKLTRQLGYKMRPAITCSTTLQVRPKTTTAATLTIPKGFQFKGLGGIVFESAQEVSIPPSPLTLAPYVNIPVYQGITTTESYTSDGTPSQVFQLKRAPAGTFIAQGTVTVSVDGVGWSETPLLNYKKSNQYEVGYNGVPPVLRFGDGASGNIPPKGVSISVSYVASAGKAGKLTKGQITEAVSKFVSLGQSVDLEVLQPAQTTGGDDPETLAEAKVNAPAYWKTNQAAVTTQDYETLASTYVDPLFGRVATAKALSARGSSLDMALQNYISQIETAVGTESTSVAAETAALFNGLIGTPNGVLPATSSSISGRLSTLLTLFTAIATSNQQTVTQLNSATSSSRLIKSSISEITADNSRLNSAGLNLATAVTAIGTGGSDTLTPATKTLLLHEISTVQGTSSTIGSAAGAASSNITSLITTVASAVDSINAIGVNLTTSGTKLFSAASERTAIVNIIGAVATPSGLCASVLTIQAASLGVTASILGVGGSGGAARGIELHVDAILSADSKSNLISVPVLSRDSDGFYDLPSNSLVQSLQSYLDTKKEVTQTVEVVSGYNFLIRPVLKIRMGVLQSVSTEVVKASAKTLLLSLFKNRAFGSGLYVSDVDIVLRSIKGVVFVNTTVVGYRKGNFIPTPPISAVLTDRTDVSGNLILNPTEVLTRPNYDPDLTFDVEIYNGPTLA